jgi:hypothetical protein
MDAAANVLTITERPYSLWFSGAMFFGFGLMMILQSESSSVMGTIFLLIGLFLLVNSPITTASLDPSRNLIVLHSRALIRKRSQEIPFMDVADIEVQHSRGRRAAI